MQNGEKKSGGDETKPVRVKRKNLENQIRKIKQRRGCSTPKAIEHICREYEKYSKSVEEMIQENILEMQSEVNGNKKLRRLLSHFCRAIKLQSSGKDVEFRFKQLLNELDPAQNGGDGE